MSSASLVFRDAWIVDGSGSPGYEGDVAIADGKIAAVGTFDGDALEEIDASGRVLAPGFIDIHTHFDPQLCWDRYATPSIEHGVTTVVIGNCSLSLAPVHTHGVDKVVSMFEVVEDIKKPTFDAAVPFSWETFPEYLAHIQKGLGINVGALLGHSAIRLYVMGDDAQKRAANSDEIEAMCAIVEEAMAAGALGISSSYYDVDENMIPVPSRFAELDEKIALCRAMAKSGRGVWQVVVFFPDMEQQLAEIREVGELSRTAGVMCSIQPVLSSAESPNAQETLEALQEEHAKGARVYGQVFPRCFDLNMRLSETSVLLMGLPTWKAAMDVPMPARIETFRDPERRSALVAEIDEATGLSASTGLLLVGQVKSRENERFVGKTVEEIAQNEGSSIGNVLLDIALADDLETEFQAKSLFNGDKQAVGKLIDQPLFHLGASDAGAHITQFCGTGDTTHVLEYFVEQTGEMSLERAIYRMTGELAKDWGLRDRGLIAVGRPADLVLFDRHEVSVGEDIFRNDFPGEASRYVRQSRGYDAVVINGEIVFRGGEYTDARSGQIV